MAQSSREVGHGDQTPLPWGLSVRRRLFGGRVPLTSASLCSEERGRALSSGCCDKDLCPISQCWMLDTWDQVRPSWFAGGQLLAMSSQGGKGKSLSMPSQRH